MSNILLQLVGLAIFIVTCIGKIYIRLPEIKVYRLSATFFSNVAMIPPIHSGTCSPGWKFPGAGKYLCRSFLILVLFIAITGQSHGQKRGDISLGMGFPELSSVGIRYQVFPQFRTGICAGWLPGTTFKSGGWNSLVSLSGDLYYHFGRISLFPERRIFYVNTGINFIQEKPINWKENWWNYYVRMGCEIHSTRRYGINIHGGVIYNLNPEKNWARLERFLPAIGANIFYRF